MKRKTINRSYYASRDINCNSVPPYSPESALSDSSCFLKWNPSSVVAILETKRF